MSWIYLVLAGLLEVAWAAGLKYTEGFTKPIPSAFTLLAMLLSVGMLGLALRHLPLGTAYAVWTGIGTIGTAIFGMMILGEPAGALRIGSIGLIALGIAGLKLLTPGVDAHEKSRPAACFHSCSMRCIRNGSSGRRGSPGKF